MQSSKDGPPPEHIGRARDPSLEAIRGYSALVVVIWHISLGFYPQASGIFSNFGIAQSLKGSPLYGLFNGSAAVAVFFVLSGYVLTRPAFEMHDSRFLLRNALKRWPRLALLVALAVLASWALFKLDLYAFEAAASVSGSPWLFRFQYAYETPFTPDLLDALRQGLFAAFLMHGQNYYDSALWTMPYEFYGSFLAFALAALLLRMPNRLKAAAITSAAILLSIAVGDPWWIGFPLGVAIARFPLPAAKRLSPALVLSTGLLALWLFGYTGEALGIQKPMAFLFAGLSPTHAWMLGAALLLFVVANARRTMAFFHNPLGRFLGWISFPLYLMHGLVLCSLGSHAYVALFQAGARLETAAAIAAVATLTVSLAVSVPLAILNDRWVAALNRQADRLLKSRPATDPQMAE